MVGRSNWRRRVAPFEQRLFAITFAVGLVLVGIAVGALLELRSSMLVAFSTLGTIDVLQASRARSVARLIDAQDEARNDSKSAGNTPPLDAAYESAIEDLAALENTVKKERELESYVDRYVDAVNAAFAALRAAPREGEALRGVTTARRSSEELDSALRERVGERRQVVQHDISRIILAVGALIAGVALVSLAQGWELLAMDRRSFTVQSASAARIASLYSTLSKSREALDVVNRRLTLAMRTAHVVVFSIEPSGKIIWSNDAGNGVFAGLTTPFLLSDLAPEADRLRILGRVNDASRSEDAIEFEMSVEQGDLGLRWLKVTLLPLDAEDQGGLLGSAADVTDMKRREEGNILLMRELSHRSKNLLAIVQAMARQTARTASGPIEFYERFGARLRALAAGHDLLVKTVYSNAELGELIRIQIGALARLIGTRVFAEGPSVQLRPEATQNLGMALHELATNAQIHGAMTNSQGRIDILWRLEGGASKGWLIVDWIESNGPRVAPSNRRGFGSTLILENLPRSLHGAVTLDLFPEGARCHMELPFKYMLESCEPDESGDEQRAPSRA